MDDSDDKRAKTSSPPSSPSPPRLASADVHFTPADSAPTSPPAINNDGLATILQELALIRNDTNFNRIMLKEVKHDISTVKAEVSGVREDVDELKIQMVTVLERVASVETELKVVKAKNAELEDKIKKVDEKADKNTDNACRDTITVHGIPRQKGSGKKGQETWPETKRILAKFLADNTKSGSMSSWVSKITRAHRGLNPTSNVMHVLLESWTHKDEIMQLFKKKQGKINNVFCLEKFSVSTTDRRNFCIADRDEIRKANPQAMCWIKYPATLMCKLPGEDDYTEYSKY